MPLKRTPPVTPEVQSREHPLAMADSKSVRSNLRNVATIEDSVHYDSEPDLRLARNKKRKHDGQDTGLAATIKESLEALSKKQDEQFSELKSIVCSVKDQNYDLTKTVELLSQKNDEFINRIQHLERVVNEKSKYITQLEDRLERTERWSRSSGIEIRNIPKIDQKPESKDELCEIVKNLGKFLNIEIKTTDIKDVYRTHSADSAQRPVVTEFTTNILKEKLLTAIKNFNKNKPKADKLNTTHLLYKRPAKPIFVSETLTQRMQRLFFLARNFQKGSGYKYCWTSRGVVYLRKDENQPQIKVECDADLDSLRKIQ